MHIGFDAKRLFTNATGLGNYSRFVIEALLEHYPDHTYRLYTPKYNTSLLSDNIAHNPNIHIRTPSSLAIAFHTESYWRSVNLGKVACRDGVQLFHGLSNELPYIKVNKLKTVLTVHDLIFKRYPEFYHPIDIKIYSLKLSKACRSADRIIAVSQQTADDLYRYFNVDKEKVRVVYQGCHPAFKTVFPPSVRTVVKLKYNLPDEFILTVGTIEQRKNALLIVKSLSRLKNSPPLVIVGSPTKYIYEIQNYIKKNHLTHKVRFIHNPEFEDLPKIYQMAKIFVYPSFFEGFGIPILEAMASGIPVITSKGSCFSETGGPYSRYIDPHDPDHLAKELEEILNNPLERKKMVAESHNYIRRFDSSQIARDLMEVYTELI